jgi:hypothetical protein
MYGAAAPPYGIGASAAGTGWQPNGAAAHGGDTTRPDPDRLRVVAAEYRSFILFYIATNAVGRDLVVSGGRGYVLSSGSGGPLDGPSERKRGSEAWAADPQ